MEFLMLALLVGGYFYWKSQQPKPPEKPLVSSYDMAECYGYIVDLLNESHRTKPDAWWQIRKASPEEGRIIAIIQWREFFGDQLGEMERRIILTIDLAPNEDGKTEIYMQWEVHSPMHRGQVNDVIDMMKSAIRRNLNAS